MAKCRKLTSSRSERYLGTATSYNFGQQTVITGAWEFGEDEIWSTIDDLIDHNDHVNSGDQWNSQGATQGSRSRRHRHPMGGLSLAFDDSNDTNPSTNGVEEYSLGDGAHYMAASAPVNIPNNWSKISRVSSTESFHGSDEPELELVPPHEYLAREYGESRKIRGDSVFEGVGRTLKGREMSRVREAVWSRTGFCG